MKWNKVTFWGIIFLGIISCSKDDKQTPLNFDGEYYGFIYNFSTKNSDSLKISISNSENTQISVKSLSGRQLDFYALKKVDENSCIKFDILSNDSIKGAPVSNVDKEHLLYSKTCKCVNFKIIYDNDTLAFASQIMSN